MSPTLPPTGDPPPPWWRSLWPFSKPSKKHVQLPPDTKPPPRAPLPKGSQSYPAIPTQENQRTQDTQTYDKAQDVQPHPLLAPRSLRSMQRFPVDDAETLVQERVSLTSSTFSMGSDYSYGSEGQDDDADHEHHGHTHHETDEGLELETDIFHTAAQSSDPFYAPYGFIIMCFFQIIWGLVGVVQASALRYAKTLAKSFLLLDKNFSDHSPFYLLVGASLTTIAGICGLIALFCSVRLMLHMIPHFMWIIVTMCLCSSITARGNLESPTVSTYYRLFEAAAVYKTDPNYLTENWPDVRPQIWHEMQKTMRCCGVENITDWLHLPERRIPDSCCLDDLRTCRAALNDWSRGKNSSKDYIDSLAEIEPFLNDDSCISALTTERENHIRDWTIYPIIYLVFHLAMMFNFNFLTQILIHEYNSWQGVARLKLFKTQSTDLLRARLFSAFLGMIPFCCQKMKKEARSEVQKQASQNVLSILKRRNRALGSRDEEEEYAGTNEHRDSIETEVERKSVMVIGEGTDGPRGMGSTPNLTEWKWKKP